MAVVASWDFPNRRIYMSAAEWHPYDIYKEYRAYRRTVEASRPFNPLLRMEGNIPKGGGKSTPRYMILLEGTKIVPVDGTVQPVTNITGEVFADDQTDFIDVSGLTQSPRINYAPPAAEIIIELAQARQLEHASFNGRVTIDVLAGFPGTGYIDGDPDRPIGIELYPSNNLADALLIAASRGFDSLYIKGNLTVNAGENIGSYHLYGQGATFNVQKTKITLTSGCITSNAHYHSLRVDGAQGGESNYHDCYIGALTNAHCFYHSCKMVGPVQFAPSIGSTHTTDVNECYSSINEYVVDQNGAQLKQVYTNWSGKIKFTNGTNAGSVIEINMDAGQVTLDSTVVAGTYRIRGTGTLVNNSQGATVDSSGLTQTGFSSVKFSIEAMRDTHQGFGERFYVDTVDGHDSNEGTAPTTPLKTVANTMGKVVSGRGDVIYLLAPQVGAATITERVVIDKEDVHIRGPGRGVQFQPSIADLGPCIDIQGNNCSMSGFLVRSAVGSTTDDCITVSGKFSKLQKLYIVGSGKGVGTGSGIVYTAGDYHEAIDCESEKCGRSGILVKDGQHPTNGSPRELSVKRGNYYLNGKDGIEFEGAGSVGSSCRLNRVLGINSHDNAGYAVRIDSLTSGTTIDNSCTFHSNSLGDVLDDGSFTHWDSAVREYTLIESIWLHVKALTWGKFLGAK